MFAFFFLNLFWTLDWDWDFDSFLELWDGGIGLVRGGEMGWDGLGWDGMVVFVCL